MFKKYITLLLSMLVALSVSLVGIIASAEEIDYADLELTVTEKSVDFIDVDVTVKNATVWGIQAAFRYDPEVLQPVNSEGEPAENFSDFRERSSETEKFKEIGLTLEKDRGVFEFTVYTGHDVRGEELTDKGEYVADEKGLHIYTLHFKRLKEGNPKLELARYDGVGEYRETVKHGITLLNLSETLPVNVIVNYEETKTEEKIEAYIPKPKVEINKDNRKDDIICLMVDKPTTITFGKKVQIDEQNAKVVPYIKNDRTMVPLRFITESLGAEIIWDEERGGCTVKKDKREIVLTFGSAEFTVNGKSVTYDAPIEVMEDRTMVPVRFISEQLDCDVYWNATNRAVVVSPMDNPWVETRKAEDIALGEMLMTILGIL